jgi:hypothetical protein
MAKDDGQLGDAEELAGNPAIPDLRRRTGGFASPSFDGYALVKLCCSELSKGIRATELLVGCE